MVIICTAPLPKRSVSKMIKDIATPQKWLKAAVLGSLWASSEIVLGSFLHNLHIPFSSSLLTAIGIILLVSASYLWNSSGLFWRAGLICALMKTISPSAVIFGPMIAIIAESFLLEAATRMLGRNIAGLLLGSALAMLWNIFQRIFNFIILYGFDIVNLYKGLLSWASNQLNLGAVSPWSPILILACFYLGFGLLAGLIGILLGKRLKSGKIPILEINQRKAELPFGISSAGHFKYNPWWILYILGMLLLGMAAINFYQWYYWIPLIVVQVVIIMNRYKRAMNSLKKPRFWIVFVLLTMLASYLLSGLSNNEPTWQQGLLTGIAMNLRAALIISGFAGLSKELYNPNVRMFFTGIGFTQLPKALEVSFGILPYIIGSLPPVKVFVKQPLNVIETMLLQSEQWLDFIQKHLKSDTCLIIITGIKGNGKTSLLAETAKELKQRQVNVQGILQPATIVDGERAGYSLLDLDSGKLMPLASVAVKQEDATIGAYAFNQKAFDFGFQIFQQIRNVEVAIVDEIGPLEVQGKGWDAPLRQLLSESLSVILISVRPTLLDQVLRAYQPSNFKVFAVGTIKANELADYIEGKIRLATANKQKE